jgi:pimeloyl-ACP methyl ester carboxylesterase
MIAWSHACSAGFTLRGEHSLPSGKPVLHFLHGNGYCGRVYWPMLEQLEADFDLFISDIQGHGDTDHGGRFHGWNRSAELALEAWQAHSGKFGAASVFAVGHSFGAVISALMLAQPCSPFQRAVLLDPVLFSPVMIGVMALSDVVGLYKRNDMAQRAHKRKCHWSGRDAAQAYLHERGMFKGWAPAALQAYIDYALKDDPQGGVVLKCRPSREAEIFSSFPRRLWSSLAKVQVPVKVDYGADSYPFVAKSVTRWLNSNPYVSAQQVAGGHCFMQQSPIEAARRIQDFLLPGGGSLVASQ